ncbi:MAG: molybdopterin-dependent oxidoreductase [bacterium]
MKRTLFGFLILFLVAAAGCGGGGGGDESKRISIGSLPQNPVEITTYEGGSLTKIADFKGAKTNDTTTIDTNAYRLNIYGLVDRPMSLTYSQVTGGFTRHKKVASVHCVENWTQPYLWEGVYFRDLVASAGPKPEATVVIFHSIDGFTTSLPIDFLMTKDIIVADKINGLTIPQNIGFPFILAAQLKWGYKWARWISGIEFSSDTNYKGTWENLGFSTIGNLWEPNRDGMTFNGCHTCHAR